MLGYAGLKITGGALSAERVAALIKSEFTKPMQNWLEQKSYKITVDGNFMMKYLSLEYGIGQLADPERQKVTGMVGREIKIEPRFKLTQSTKLYKRYMAQGLSSDEALKKSKLVMQNYRQRTMLKIPSKRMLRGFVYTKGPIYYAGWRSPYAMVRTSKPDIRLRYKQEMAKVIQKFSGRLALTPKGNPSIGKKSLNAIPELKKEIADAINRTGKYALSLIRAKTPTDSFRNSPHWSERAKQINYAISLGDPRSILSLKTHGYKFTPVTV